MAAVRTDRVLVDARHGAGMGIVHLDAFRARTAASASLADRAGGTRSGFHICLGGTPALGIARREPGHGRGRSGRQPWVFAVCPMMACRLRVAMNEAVIQR